MEIAREILSVSDLDSSNVSLGVIVCGLYDKFGDSDQDIRQVL